jgi:hypothetical protein
MGIAMRGESIMREAERLAKDGEIGNSNAIQLLQIPHSPEDLKQLLAKYDKQLTREARGKLALASLTPLPDGVENQRYEPIFDRHPISGRTYTTASGTVVPNEVQYYNGEMVQIYGECTNVALVREALSGSGHKPLILRYANGSETAVAHFWCHNLSDTSLRPYNAAFVIIVAVPDGLADGRSSIEADENGASSVLSVLDGSFDAATKTYENRARLFYLRLLDSTRVAIEVGRERMGTDKRPGTIDLAHLGKQISFLTRDGAGNVVARVTATPTDDPASYRSELAKAAATAGIPLGAYPPGTERVFPSVSRIGTGPVVSWQWRTDLTPRLQPVQANTVVFDASSEEGAFFIRWGFQPKVLAYLPNVRGVVTGIPESAPPSLPRKVRILNAATRGFHGLP